LHFIAEVVRVTDCAEIAARGAMNTPGLVIDGEVKSTGCVPAQVTSQMWLTAAG